MERVTGGDGGGNSDRGRATADGGKRCGGVGREGRLQYAEGR